MVPLTSNVERVLMFQVFMPADRTGLHKDSKAQAEQIRTLDISRIGAVLGVVPPDLMAEVDEALRIHLQL